MRSLIRLLLCEENTEEDVDYIIETLPTIVANLRKMSPLWETIQKEQNA